MRNALIRPMHAVIRPVTAPTKVLKAPAVVIITSSTSVGCDHGSTDNRSTPKNRMLRDAQSHLQYQRGNVLRREDRRSSSSSGLLSDELLISLPASELIARPQDLGAGLITSSELASGQPKLPLSHDAARIKSFAPLTVVPQSNGLFHTELQSI